MNNLPHSHLIKKINSKIMIFLAGSCSN
uniref:Uncharacterized protein n=1 Tax=Anguilla anguilla TaxID=7936 RepID=A0A0E9V876_ANGAN